MNKNRKILKVVAAVIRKGDRVFATQRGYGEYKDWWEFPGGKIEAGETAEEALVREIHEELDADITVDQYITTVEYDYPEFHLSMDCFWCSLKSEHLALLEHEASKWLRVSELGQVNWLPADILVVNAILADKKDRSVADNGTIQYYEEHAEEFAANTLNADMEDIRRRFLVYLPAKARILDFGCGTGRDTKVFRDLAYEVTALDGSEALCRIACDYTGAPVKHMDFRQYSPAEEELYEGIWACASLLHLKKQELLPVMQNLGKALNEGGTLYVSFKYGDYEGERNGRYFTDFTMEGFREYLKMLPEFRMVEYWVTGDVRPGRGNERWLNMLLEKMK